MNLKLERRDQEDTTGVTSRGKGTLLTTPTVGEDYWAHGVIVGEHPPRRSSASQVHYHRHRLRRRG
jgi:hypothetical protein